MRRFLRYVVTRASLRLLPGILLCGGLAVSTAPAAGPTDAAELETYLDGLVASLMETHHVPGAVVVVVRDGGIFLAKGYGKADVDSGRPVDPESTLFRVASVSKLFTTTAVMKLVELGRLDLNADVNDYLDQFSIEAKFGRPVTLANLMTHTPGFDDEYLRTVQSLQAPRISLDRFLANEMPEQVLAPGDLISYSNQGMALAGYLVERVSGVPFDAFVSDRILQPLGMTSSRFGIPTSVPAGLAIGYEYRNGRHRSMGFDRLIDYPAGDLITTGNDIARFMIMQLQLGIYGEERILAEDTATMMQSRQFAHHPALTGWCYGFYEGRHNGMRTIEHGGSWRGFGTELTLVPSSGFGLFVSTNLEYTPRFFRTLHRQFFDRYFPEDGAGPGSGREDLAARAAEIPGNYLSVRRVRNSILKLGDFVGTYRVDLSEDDELVLNYPGGALPPARFIEVEPRLFRDVDSDAMLTYRPPTGDRPLHLLLGGGALEKVNWRNDPVAHRLLLLGALIVFGLTAIGWTIGFIVRMLVMGPPSPIRGKARFTAFLVCTAQSVFLVGLAIGFRDIDIYGLMEAVPDWLKWLLALPLISLILTLPLCYFTWRGYHKDLHDPLARLHYGLITVTSIVVLVLEWHWNVLGYHF